MLKTLIMIFLITESFAMAANPGLSLEETNAVIQEFYNLYQPVAQSEGVKLVIKNLWEKTEDQAYMNSTKKNVWELQLYGGIPRLRTQTKDDLRLILCHEMGHVLGGKPYKHDRKVSVEGQADYFAANKCMPKLLANEDNLKAVKKLNPPGDIEDACAIKGFNENKRAICIRTLLASVTATTVFAIDRRQPVPSVLNYDPNEVTGVLTIHPGPQCRLDTFLAGATNASRPKCWYWPSR